VNQQSVVTQYVFDCFSFYDLSCVDGWKMSIHEEVAVPFAHLNIAVVSFRRKTKTGKGGEFSFAPVGNDGSGVGEG
jgi:hypothetical protein